MKASHRAFTAGVLFLVAGVSWPALADLAVTGTGDPARDVPAVQAAVDQGGRITLRGTFGFGERGQVRIGRDVEIVGSDGARVEGGLWTFHSPRPEVLPPPRPGPRIAIRNLHFDGALHTPIRIEHASALELSGNRITGVRPRPTEAPEVPQAHAGILLGPGYGERGKPDDRFKGVLSGSVRIENNVIDLATPEPVRTLGHGVFGTWMIGADVTVTGNTVANVSRNAIEFIDNYRDAAGHGRVRVAGNRISAPERGFAWPGPNRPNGVVVGYFWDEPAAHDPAQSVPMEVTANLIDLLGEESRAVVVLANGVQVRDNTITAAASRTALVWVAGSGAELSGNVFRGVGTTAVSISPFRTLTGSRNRLAGNDLREFKGSDTVIFNGGASDNECVGPAGMLKVADYGVRNRCR